MRRACLLLLGILINGLLIGALAACDPGPVVVVATPVPADAKFHTYRHPSGVFSLRLPPDWSVRDLSHDNTIRVEFSPPGSTGLPLTVYVVNTGTVLDATSFLDELNHYQATVNGNSMVYTETSRNAQGDGSWRLAGIRQTPLGPRELNTFLQYDKSFLSAIEIDITGASDAMLQTLTAVVNTFRVDSTAVIGASHIQAADSGDSGGGSTATGILTFDGLISWTNAQGTFVVNGQVTNQAGRALEGVRITAILYDAQNNALVEQANVLPVEVLADRATSAFSIHFRNGKPSQAVRYEVQAVARNAEYALQTHLGDDSFIKGNDKATYDAGGVLTVSGDVVNKTKGIARFVKVSVILYDEQQRVIATDSAFLSKPDLQPGDTGHYEIPLYEIGGNAARYVISVEGKSG